MREIFLVCLLYTSCEKPAGVYTKQVREMNEAAEKSGLVFGMMFNQRTNHVYRKMHELVNSGELGAIKRVNWIITNWYRAQSYYCLLYTSWMPSVSAPGIPRTPPVPLPR